MTCCNIAVPELAFCAEFVRFAWLDGLADMVARKGLVANGSDASKGAEAALGRAKESVAWPI